MPVRAIAGAVCLALVVAQTGWPAREVTAQVPLQPHASSRVDQPESRTVPAWVTTQPDFSATLIVTNQKLDTARGLEIRFTIHSRGNLYRLEALKPFPAWFACGGAASGNLGFLCSGPFFLEVTTSGQYHAHVPQAWLDAHRDREDDLGPLLFALAPYPIIVSGIALAARTERPAFQQVADFFVDGRPCETLLVSGAGFDVVYRVAIDPTLGNLVALAAVEDMHREGIADYGDYSGLRGKLENVRLGSPAASLMKIPDGYGAVELGE